MNELFLEIEEDLRRERYEKLWSSFGRTMVWVSIAVVLATVIFVVWQDHKRDVAAEKTALLLQGIDRLNIEDYKGAVPIFSSLAEDDSSPYYGIAMLRKAHAQTLSGDKEGAAKTYKELAGHNNVFGNLAGLAAEGDASTSESVFHYSYAEKQAWDALARGDKDEAAKLFLGLVTDETTPRTLAARAQEVLQHITPEKFKKGEKPNE